MISGKTVLAIIPARGGSKGVPRKNIRNIAGKPLIAWTIAAAQRSKYIDRLILSSEDEEIIQIAQAWGCELPFRRPAELAQDCTPSILPIIYTLEQLAQGMPPKHYDYVVLLQPTSPLRNVTDIDSCLEKCVNQQSNACVSVTKAEQNPYWMYMVDADSRMRSLMQSADVIPRRQDLPTVYALNGAIYVAKCEWLLQTKSFLTEETIAYLMPQERSLDIDTEIDLAILEIMLQDREYATV
ncbi:N-acylneuraminate cytidylyltransferase [Tumidithrix helvetica PCC 7403]|uniref:acylneuraminate cytidylyltransferase family protein n=1 Tax=Tumidithrix helvetica TaxID=3457545 RepID=UPI003C8CE535